MNVIRVWNIGGMTLTGRASPSASLFTTNPASTDLGSNPFVMATGRRLTAGAKAWPSPADHKVFQFKTQYNMPTTGFSRGRMRACVVRQFSNAPCDMLQYVRTRQRSQSSVLLDLQSPELEDTTLSGNGEIHHPMTKGQIPNERKPQLHRCENLEHQHLCFIVTVLNLNLLPVKIFQSFCALWYFIYNDIYMDSNTRNLNRMAATRSTFKSEPS